MEFPPLPFVLRNGLSDAAKLGMTHYRIWDKIIAAARRRGLIPQSQAGRWSATTILSVAGAFVDWNLHQETAWTKVLREVVTDAASELGSRMSDAHSPAPAPARPSDSPVRGIEALWEMEPEHRSMFISAFGRMDRDQRRRMHAHVSSLTARELAVVADMTDQERTTFLELLFPLPDTSFVDEFRWSIRHMAAGLNRYSGRDDTRSES